MKFLVIDNYRGDIMARVECDVDYITLENDKGREVDGVQVTCGKCGKCTQSFGTTYKSIKRCLVLLREDCDCDENNFYVVPE